MATKIKSNHPFSVIQLSVLNKELKKISNFEVVSLKGISISGKKNFADINVLKSPYSLDVFLAFTDVSIAERPKYNTIKIGINGDVDYDTKRNLEFNNLADRVSFFNSLEPIEFNY
jgi:hypothetical protein